MKEILQTGSKTLLLPPRKKMLATFAAMLCLMAWMIPAMAQQQLPFTVTTSEDVTNHTEKLYWIEANGATGFYAIPHTDDTYVSTTNMPNLKALWYFMDASDGYYYIVNHSTGLYLKLDGTLGQDETIKLASFGSGGDDFKFSVTGSDGQWSFCLKSKSGSTSYYVNKKTNNVSYILYLKASSYYDANSKWNIVPRNSVTWAHPFSNSTNDEKHYYNIHNATSNGSAFYMSIDDASAPYATVSNVDDNKRIWYFMEADDSDNTIPNLKYYYIVNAITGKYLKFTGTADGSSQASSLQLYEHDGTETGETEDSFQFMVLDATGKTYSAYSIMPKLEISNYDNKNASLSPSDNYSNSLSNGMKIGIYNDRGQDNNYAHWTIEETALVKAPTITDNYDGYISLSTTTPGTTIYYTLDGTTPDNTSTAYSSAFPLGDATVIKAIAYLGSECSIVSIYNVPKYPTPTISYNNSTSEITITCTGATGIYYTTDGSTPTTSSTPYSASFTASPGDIIKAIATHAGYLNSDVATKYIQGNNYSRNYLTFNVLTAGEIPWKSIGSGMEKKIFYRINGGSWTSITAGSNTISVVAGDVVEFKGSNSRYASNNSNYSGFDGGTATYDISGNIMSLIYGDGFVGKTTMSDPYNFCSIFKQSKAVSAENLILPATTLTNYCYRAMFSKAHELVAAPALPATTLATGCYWYMFDECPISIAPDLDATELVAECYGHMFEKCSNLNYIKCLATDNMSASKCLEGWVANVSSTGTFVKKESVTWPTGNNGTPTGWNVVDDGTPDIPTISFDGFVIELSCATTGAVIYYQLDHSGGYTSYSTPITINSDTFIECYSEKEGKTSATISQTCVYDSRTIFEYSNQSLDTWTYGGNTITTPYSVNAIDGHSSSYAKGKFYFETDVNLRSPQPTYLWFQHADQSAVIYVDGTEVGKHWGGYNAFFVDIADHVHQGTNHIKVALKNNEGNVLAPYTGDFNFNATLGKVKLFTSPCLPSMSYGYDGFHITSTVSSAEATINVKTTIPTGATVVCTISGVNCEYTESKNSTGDELVFTHTITNPRLWNGTLDPYLYNVKLEIYHDGELYHSYERPYGLRFYRYVINETVNGNSYTGFLLNGQPYLLRGCCMHDDIAGKANALNDDDYTQTFAIIQELGNNFLRLAHYPHPKEVYDWCDRLGIVVQTEGPCVNHIQSTMPEDYWTHLVGQYDDMVNQHYNHPCIMFWGLSNEAKVDDKTFAKTKIEGYVSQIKALDSERMVGLVGHSLENPSDYFGDPSNIDWIGSNLYQGWYQNNSSNNLSNNPTSRLDNCIRNTITRVGKAYAFSEYGGGGTQRCHSETPSLTTNKGSNGARHDIEYQMWLHEGHIAAIKNKPELLFTSEWQLFDIAVAARNEGFTACPDGENTTIDDELRRLNDKGLVERDHKTKKDTYYLYKAWWNTTDLFVHICGKNYLKTANRVIKCYTNDGNELTLYVNGVSTETVTVTDNIATFTARNFSDGDLIKVSGATSEDTFTIHSYGENVFIKEGDWNTASNWSGNAVPNNGSDVLIAAKATIPANSVVDVNEISVIPGATLTIADGGQLFHNNNGVTATVKKNIAAHGTTVAEGGWNFIATPITNGTTPSTANGILSSPENSYDLFFYDEPNHYWRNYKTYGDNTNPNFDLSNGQGYLYANAADTQIEFTGTLRASNEAYTNNLSYTSGIGNLAGFNLVGNPFACNATVDKPCYIIQDGVIVATTGTVAAPCSGVMVKATDTDQSVTFTRTTDAAAFSTGRNQLNITIANNNMAARGERSMIDNAIISFNENSQLEKFYFGTQNANIYIPQNGEEYAIVSIGRDVSGNVSTNEMPLNFKATENGNYTLTVSPEGVDLNYLHLIDNLTGADVDLLALRRAQGPAEYTFKAKTTDYASRFKLIFSTNSEDGPSTGSGTFAFIDAAGNIVITDGPSTGSGTYTLQVIDMMGRIIVTRGGRIQCVPTSGMTPGVYVLRLISGNGVKTQKIVVK